MQSTGALSTQTASLQAAESFESQPDAPNYPVLTLPPEIVSEIFVAFLPAYPGCPPIFGLRSPLLLCRICRRWRAIAIATPGLWGAIRIGCGVSRESGEAAAQLELPGIWLSRSGGCPLSMGLSLRGGTRAVEGEIFRTAVLHSERWEYADLSLSAEELCLIQVAMPLLRHLTLRFNNLIPSEPITLFDRAPRLKQVVLTRGFGKSVITLPWGQLTCLDAHFLYLGECAEILHDATNLVHCSLGICRTSKPTLILLGGATSEGGTSGSEARGVNMRSKLPTIP
jgi:hypothetical protein